jgi:hypothetical protein
MTTTISRIFTTTPQPALIKRTLRLTAPAGQQSFNNALSALWREARRAEAVAGRITDKQWQAVKQGADLSKDRA